MRSAALLSAVTLMGCASTGVISTGGDSYMLSKTGAGGMFSSGAAVKADLYTEANAFCAKRGMVVETISATDNNAIPFVRMNNAGLNFKCVPKP